MQAGLMATYHNPVSTRGALAWVLAAVLVGFYVDLYFYEHLTPIASAIGLPSKWSLYGLLYCVAMLFGGWFMLRRHGNSTYHKLRTISLVSVQIVLAFSLPLVMKIAGHPEYYFSYFWPLSYDKLFPSTLTSLPWYLAAYSVVGTAVAVPILTYFYGKRWYCSWVCGCGGLAETFGEPWRHLSDKSQKAWKFEQVSIHTVLLLVCVVTGLQIADAAGAEGVTHVLASQTKSAYGFAIGAVWSGVIGVGFYPLMGTRVWCRFGCPMAAMLGLIQKFGRFRITVKKDMCISCGNCSAYCEMGIDVRQYAMQNRDVKRASCVGCGMCAHVCPRGVLRLETRRDAGPGVHTQQWTVDL
ncbi:MAG: 4Fe-4S binding protein [Myxococcota bacterium]